MKIIPRVAGDRDKAARLERTLNHEISRPFTDGDGLRWLLVTVWLLVDYQRRLRNFWECGVMELS